MALCHLAVGAFYRQCGAACWLGRSLTALVLDYEPSKTYAEAREKRFEGVNGISCSRIAPGS